MKIFNLISKPENTFLIFALFFGLLFVVLTPPFQVPDEPEHFYKMYGFTEGSLTFKKLENEAGQILPQSMVELGKQYKRMAFHPNVKTSKKEITESLSRKLEKNDKVFLVYSPTAYTPISYTPQFLILWFMKLVNINPLWMLYILRICSLFLYTGLIYTAIKTIPFRKWLFTLISTLPMSLYMASGVSTDGLTMGLCFIFIAYVLRLALNKEINKLTKKDWIIFAALISLITICKFAYLPLIFMYFMIPKEKFKSKNLRLKYFWILLGINTFYVLAFLFTTIHLSQGLNLDYQDLSINKFDLIKSILKHPIHYMNSIFATIVEYSGEHLETLIGRLGWFDTLLPSSLISTYTFLLISTSVCDTGKEATDIDYSAKNKFIGFAIYFTVLTIILTSIHVLYNRELPAIWGLQGRYLLPVFPLFCLFCSVKRLQCKYLPLLIITCSIVLMCITFTNMLERFYG